MKLSNVKPETWISYKGIPYSKRATYNKMTTLWDVSGNTIEVHMDEDVDLIEVPTFNIGDLVLYKGTVDQYDNQIVTITYIYDTKFMPYRVNDSFQVSPFELHKIEY